MTSQATGGEATGSARTFLASGITLVAIRRRPRHSAVIPALERAGGRQGNRRVSGNVRQGQGAAPAVFLGVDMGGTATRWVLLNAAGAEIGAGTGPGATGLLFDTAAREAFGRALAGVPERLRALGAPGIARACLGVTGIGTGPAPEVMACLRDALPDTGPMLVLNDLVLAWHAAFPQGGPGHLVAAGTGSAGVSVDAAGRAHPVGGRGHVIDDGGSGCWIALRALDAIYRRIDAHGRPAGAEKLAAALFAAMGGAEWEHTRAFVYGGDRGRIGMLANAVAEAAREGDALAVELLHRAGAELGRLGAALIGRHGPAPLVAVGGVLRLHPAVRAGVEAALPDAEISYPEIASARHAARMAHRQHSAPQGAFSQHGARRP